MSGQVVAVARCSEHEFSKPLTGAISLLAGLGVEGDAHLGTTVQHRSRVAVDPDQPNLRQVHLIPLELIDALRTHGFDVGPGVIGENITTRAIDLLSLPRRTRLRLGPHAMIEVTGLRNPCLQLDNYQKGLTRAVLDRGPNGELIRKAGIMAVVIEGGLVRTGDAIGIDLPKPPFEALAPV